jgi:Tol biopolymer transport system component
MHHGMRRISTLGYFTLLLGGCADPPLSPEEERASLAAQGSLTPPSHLSATAISPSQIDLFWRDNSSSETGFEVRRSTTGLSGTFAPLTKTGSNITTYSNIGLSPSTQYCYRVRAFRKIGSKTSYSAFSTATCVSTPAPRPPPPPSELTVVARTVGVDLDADGYQIFVLEGGGGWHSAALPVNGAVTFADVKHGTVTVELSGDAPNCYPTSPASPVISYQASTTVTFELTCGRGTPIAYASMVNGNAEIYSINSTGTGGATRLTIHPAADAEPAWSPDGSRIAFRSDRDGNDEIYVMNADGSNPVRLTLEAAHDGSPAWSPDGEQIAFVSDRDGEQKVYVMSSSAGGDLSPTNQVGTDPAWSPDGQRIAFSAGAIYVMNFDGSSVTRLTNPFVGVQGQMQEHDSNPAWSPDGASILFDRTNCDGFGFGCLLELMVVKTDGSREEACCFQSNYMGEPAWSPEGRKIAFVLGDSIFVARADWSNGTTLTAGSNPAWLR